jgi:hypothetical protein
MMGAQRVLILLVRIVASPPAQNDVDKDAEKHRSENSEQEHSPGIDTEHGVPLAAQLGTGRFVTCGVSQREAVESLL